MADGLDQVRAVMAAPEDIELPDGMDMPDHGGPEDHGYEDRGDFVPDDHGSDASAPPLDDSVDPETLRRCAAFALNDVGNGKRFSQHYGPDAMWVPRVGWFTWTGKVWAKDADEIVVRRMGQNLGPLLEQEIPHITLSDSQMTLLQSKRELLEEHRALHLQTNDDGKLSDVAKARTDRIGIELEQIGKLEKSLSDIRKAHRNFARTTGNSGRIDAALREGGVGLAKQLDQIDPGGLDINTTSGVLRFSVSTGPTVLGGGVARVDLIPHDRAHLLTKMMTVGYDPVAQCPQFIAFMRRIMPEDHMRRFMQRWFGLSMTALTGEQKLAFFFGMGANGKSVLINLIARLMGDYASTAKIESLTGSNRRGGGDATPDLVPLIGARFVSSNEPDKGVQWQEGLLKELTGGDAILVRALHSDFVEVNPLFKLTIAGNHKPDIRGTDDGIWRRLLIVPFDQQIPKSERDQGLLDKLVAEGPGILNWMVEGLLDYLEGGLQEPDEVLQATTELREESDVYGTFLDDACTVTGSAEDSIGSRDLVNAFHYWLADRGEGQFKDRTVAIAIKDRSRRWRSRKNGQMFNERKSNGRYCYDGIRFTDIFRAAYNNAPKDQQGKPLLGRSSDMGDA